MTEGFRFLNPIRWVLPILAILILSLLGVLRIQERRARSAAQAQLQTAPHAVVPSSAPAHPPPGRVPKPRPLTLADIPAPTPWDRLASLGKLPELKVRIDLDYFAPLGEGTANAAIWFRDFAWDGSRAAELKAIELKEVKVFGEDSEAYPPDLPLLREAEPWVDQSTCRFFPDVWKPAEMKMHSPSLPFALNLARSWVVRGEQEKDPVRAKEEFRRAIRLGRLLMQDDMWIIQHLAAWSCISLGLEGLNHVAHREGDAMMVAATNFALADFHGMRVIASGWLHEMAISESIPRIPPDLNPSFTEEHIDRLIAHARGNPLRCFRAEAAYSLKTVEMLGTRGQRQKADAALAELARDPDAELAAYVREPRNWP